MIVFVYALIAFTVFTVTTTLMISNFIYNYLSDRTAALVMYTSFVFGFVSGNLISQVFKILAACS